MNRKLPFLAATLSILTVMSGLLVLGGCASTRQSKDKQALVCPECKMVAETVERPHFSELDTGIGLGVSQETHTIYKDTCSGCQGVIETLFKEGKWKHKCSVCKDKPFTCPVSHPRKT